MCYFDIFYDVESAKEYGAKDGFFEAYTHGRKQGLKMIIPKDANHEAVRIYKETYLYTFNEHAKDLKREKREKKQLIFSVMPKERLLSKLFRMKQYLMS
jgi:hypothetical protein